MNQATTVATGMGFPEGLRWHDDQLWFSDIYGKRTVHTLDDDGGLSDVLSVPNCPSGLGWSPGGDLLVVSMEDCQLLRLPAGAADAELVADMSAMATVLNDMVVAADGTAYIGDIGFEFGDGDFEKGQIVKVSPEGDASVVVEDACLPNGMVITGDGEWLIVAETLAARLSRHRIGPDGSLGERETFHAFDDLGWTPDQEVAFSRAVIPDGICLNAKGEIWVGNPVSTEITCVNDQGDVVDAVQLSQTGVACALGGPSMDTLFVATGDLGDQAGTQGKIEAATVSTPGA